MQDAAPRTELPGVATELMAGEAVTAGGALYDLCNTAKAPNEVCPNDPVHAIEREVAKVNIKGIRMLLQECAPNNVALGLWNGRHIARYGYPCIVQILRVDRERTCE